MGGLRWKGVDFGPLETKLSLAYSNSDISSSYFGG